MGETIATPETPSSQIHKEWVRECVKAGLAEFNTSKTVTVKNVPKGSNNTVKLPYEAPEFKLKTLEDITKLWSIAEEFKGTVKAEDGKTDIPADNPINGALGYALGLNGRTKTRNAYENQHQDPEAATRKFALVLMKQNPKKFKTIEKAMEAARMLREDDDDEADETDAE